MTPRAALLCVACALAARSAGGARPNRPARRASLGSLRVESSQKSEASLADWMAEDAETLYPRTLHELTLPGTHDSGAYWLSKQTMPDARFPPRWAAAAIATAERLGVPVDEIITNWALTQSADVGTQLHSGYRYLDIRAGWNGTTWCVHHAEVGVAIEKVLHDLATFIRQHAGEFVVTQISHLDGAPSEARIESLKTLVANALRGFLVPVAFAETGIPSLNRTLGEMVSMNERVLVVFGNGDYFSAAEVSEIPRSGDESFLWPPRLLHNAWANTDNPNALLDFAREKTIGFNDGTETGAPGSLFKFSWTLTAQTGTVVESVIPGRPKTLRELNENARRFLSPFVEKIVKARCRSSNILSVDFAEDSDAVRAARSMNALVSEPRSEGNTRKTCGFDAVAAAVS